MAEWWQNAATVLGGMTSGAMAGIPAAAATGGLSILGGAAAGGLIAGLQLMGQAEASGNVAEAQRLQRELMAKYGPMVDEAKSILQNGGNQAIKQLQALATRAEDPRLNNAIATTEQQTAKLLGGIDESTGLLKKQMEGPTYYDDIQKQIADEKNPAQIYRQALQEQVINDRAGQEANLNRTLAQRGVSGPQAAAAQATLAAQRAKDFFGASSESSMMGADFEARRQENLRKAMEAGGILRDTYTNKYNAALRDPQGLAAALTNEQQAGAQDMNKINIVRQGILDQFNINQGVASGVSGMANGVIGAANSTGAVANAGQAGLNASNANIGTAIAEGGKALAGGGVNLAPLASSLQTGVGNALQAGANGVQAAGQALGTGLTNRAFDDRIQAYRPQPPMQDLGPTTLEHRINNAANDYSPRTSVQTLPYRRNAQGSR